MKGELLIFIFGQEIKLRDERGAALLLSITLLVLFSLLTVSMFTMLTTTSQITGNHRHDLKAMGAADAGAEDAMNQLCDNPELGDGEIPHVFAGSLTKGGTYLVIIRDPPEEEALDPIYYREKYILSQGTFDSVSRTLKVHVGVVKW